MWRSLALAALLCALAPSLASAGRASAARAESRRQETERAVDQILTGHGVQSGVARILYLGQQTYATAALLRALERGLDTRATRDVAFAFSQLGVRSAEPALLTMLRDDDSAVRMSALQALARIRSTQVRKMAPLLRDRSMGVRREAARALGAGGKAPEARLLMEVARQEAEPEVRAAMLIAVGEIGDRKQARALEGFLRSSSESTRFAAARALCRLGSPAGFQVARKLLTASDRFERRHGLALFEGARARDAEKVLRPMLRDPDPTVAATAARILYQGGDERMLDWLVLTSARAPGEARLAYETELETLHLADDRRKQILARAGIKAPQAMTSVAGALLLVLLGNPPQAPAAQARWMDLSEAERERALAALPEGPLPARILAVSERFLQVPYGFSPLGEGEGKDPDPLIRFDLVDCLTYVEETMALSMARSSDQVGPLLAAIRYQERVDYADRNHLMEAQWLPSNVKKGFLREATARHAGLDAQHAAKVVTAATWKSNSSRALDLPPDRQLVGRFPLDIIPLDRALALARKIPTGTLLLVVREDLPGKVTRITHLGFVVQRGKRTFLRHASRNPFNRVVDEDLESFLTRNSRYEKWRVDGVSLYDVLQPAVVP